MMVAVLLVVISIALAIGFGSAWYTARREARRLHTKYGGVEDAESVEAEIRAEISEMQAEREDLRVFLDAESEQAELQSVGLYENSYDFDDSSKYKDELRRIRDRQKQLVRDKRAAVCDTEWTVGESKAQGRKMINEQLKLMLRAFNGECDAAVSRVSFKNIQRQETRVDKSFDAVNRLARSKQCAVTNQYLQLKMDELHLVYEYQEKLQEEKEEQRLMKEQMRDEQRAARELDAAKKKAEAEERNYAAALGEARGEVAALTGAKQEKMLAQIAELERRLAEIEERKRAISQAQQTRAGHVYVISNIGSFGDDVFKIGMTRRITPMDRVKELSDASVPFNFDVHAMIPSKDAPALETALHKAFANRRINRVNMRREFFRGKLSEIREQVDEAHTAEVHWTLLAEAREYRETMATIKAEQSAPVPQPSRLHQRAERRWSSVPAPAE